MVRGPEPPAGIFRGQKKLMDPADTRALFTHADGQYMFACRGSPIVPEMFGLPDMCRDQIYGLRLAALARM